MNQQDSTLTWSQVYQDFKGALAGAGEALKTGSEHVYEVLIRQQFINSVSWILIYVALLIVTYKTWLVVVKYVSEKRIQEKALHPFERGDWAAMYIIPSILTLTTGLTFAATILETITGFLNPEYGAIQEIMKFIK